MSTRYGALGSINLVDLAPSRQRFDLVPQFVPFLLQVRQLLLRLRILLGADILIDSLGTSGPPVVAIAPPRIGRSDAKVVRIGRSDAAIVTHGPSS